MQVTEQPGLSRGSLCNGSHIRKGQQLYINQSICPIRKQSCQHSRAIELEVKIFFISDMLTFDVWKDLRFKGLGKQVDVKGRRTGLEDVKRERRRRSMSLSTLGFVCTVLGLSSACLLRRGLLVGQPAPISGLPSERYDSISRNWF